MSKRHQSNRRKTYGRRQHELTERRGHDHAPFELEAGADEFALDRSADRVAFLDPNPARLRYALGD